MDNNNHAFYKQDEESDIHKDDDVAQYDSEDDDTDQYDSEDGDADQYDDGQYVPSDDDEEKEEEDSDQHAEKKNNINLSLDLLEGEDTKKLTVAQCRDYLRKHGLPVSGTKQILLQRILEHSKKKRCHPDIDIAEDFAKLNLQTSVVEEMKVGAPERMLTVQQCKEYLRTHGLRLTGTKQILNERVKEHIELRDGSGIDKHPETTFTKDCQGNACKGDVVLFEQRVYDNFNVGGRCSTGPPIGLRKIAGRIIKESYGASKQQHTFTIEVLWSTGERPLLPLHPLIIKGRNLYRMKILRQPWLDEEARKKHLQEKYSRGNVARMERTVRLEKKNYRHDVRKHDEKNSSQNASATFHLASAKGKEECKMVDRRQLSSSQSNQVIEPISSIELRFHNSIAGIIIGKKGATINDIVRVSQANIEVHNDITCIVKITGTYEQRSVALHMINNKVTCRYHMLGGGCKYGDGCKFSHSLLRM